MYPKPDGPGMGFSRESRLGVTYLDLTRLKGMDFLRPLNSPISIGIYSPAKADTLLLCPELLCCATRSLAPSGSFLRLCRIRSECCYCKSCQVVIMKGHDTGIRRSGFKFWLCHSGLSLSLYICRMGKIMKFTSTDCCDN